MLNSKILWAAVIAIGAIFLTLNPVFAGDHDGLLKGVAGTLEVKKKEIVLVSGPIEYRDAEMFLLVDPEGAHILATRVTGMSGRTDLIHRSAEKHLLWFLRSRCSPNNAEALVQNTRSEGTCCWESDKKLGTTTFVKILKLQKKDPGQISTLVDGKPCNPEKLK